MLKYKRLVLMSAALAAFAPAMAADNPTPGEAATRAMAFLTWEAGIWDADITLFSPGADPVTFAGEQTDRLGACGQWLITDLTMKPGPGGEAPPYEGHGVLGFDSALGKLVGVWVDPKTHWLATAEGWLSEDDRTLTLDIQGRHPVTGEPMTQRFVTTRLGENSRRLETFMPLFGEELTRVARIDYTRRDMAGGS